MTPGEQDASGAELLAEIERLRRENERLRVVAGRDRGLLDAVLEHSPHGIIVCDAQGKLILQNRAAERIWAGSASADSVEGWGRYRAFHPDGRPYQPEDWAMSRCLSFGQVVEAEEVLFQRFDGTRGVLLGSCAPIRSPAGALEGALSVFADITPFKETEAALRRAERAAAERARGLQEFTVALSASTTAEEIGAAFLSLGLPIAGGQVGSLFLLRGGKLHLFALSGMAETQVVPFRTLPVDADVPAAEAFRDGSPVWLRSAEEVDARYPHLGELHRATGGGAWAALPLNGRSGPVGALGLAFAEPRSFEGDDRELLLTIATVCAQALERARLFQIEREAREFQNQLIGIVSHDLRTPLTVVLADAQTLARNEATGGSERQKAARLLRNAQRMQRIVQDLVDYTQAQAESGLPVSPRQVDFHDVCQRVVASFSALHPERAIRYRPADARAVGNWDSDRLEQLLENLLRNGLKHGARNGPVELSWTIEGSELVVAVHNEGEPIPAEVQQHLFEPFRRGAAGKESLGLGLFIVKQIASAHCGSVAARSDREHGTTFTVRLPVGEPAGSARATTAGR